MTPIRCFRQLVYDMEKNSDYIEWSPWLPNIFTCVQDIATIGFHQTNVRLPWNGIMIWIIELLNQISSCPYQEMASAVLPAVLGMVMIVIYAMYSTCLIKVSGGE